MTFDKNNFSRRDKVELFDELARIFSEDNNQMTCRELLMKEGTAKVAANVGENDRHLQKVLQREFSNGMVSTGFFSPRFYDFFFMCK